MPFIAGCGGTENGDSDGGDGGENGENAENGTTGSENDTSDGGSEENDTSDGNDTDNSSEDEGESSDESGEDAAANAEQGEDVLENQGLVIEEHEYSEDEFSGSVEGIVENTTDEQKDYVEVRVRAYDADGNQLDNYLDNTTDLQAGGTWAFEVMILDYEDMEEYDIQVSDSPF